MREVFCHSYGEESYGLVYDLGNGLYAVYEIPQYGGAERWYKDCDTLEEAIEVAKSFT